MAASGSNEHYEACKQEEFMNRRAYLARVFWDKYASKTHDESPQILERKHTTGTSLEQQDILRAYHLEKTYRRHEEMSKTLKQHCPPTYSTKLSHRFTSVNYSQQW